MSFVRESVTVGGKQISIETGKWAKQASGSVVIRCGDSMVLVTATGIEGAAAAWTSCRSPASTRRSSTLPARSPAASSAARVGPSTDEILICRLMDRPIRPMFPKSWRCIDTQLIANVVSFDQANAADVLAMTGASAALHLSDLAWAGPLAAVRVGRVDGQFVAFPTFAEREKSDIDIIVAASRDAIMMVEGEMREVPEKDIIDALMFAHEAAQPLIDLQEKLRAAVGKEKRVFDGAQGRRGDPGAGQGAGLEQPVRGHGRA